MATQQSNPSQQDAAATGRTRCGMPCLEHTHVCDRAPGHIGVHRDVRQNGDHTCEWDTPGPKDHHALMVALRAARTEMELHAEEVADFERTFSEGVAARREAQEDRDDALREAEKARTEVERLRAERSIDMEALRVAAADLKHVRAERDEARAELGEASFKLGQQHAEVDYLTAQVGRVEALRARWKATVRDPSIYQGGIEHAAALAASHLPALTAALDGTEAQR